MDSAIHMYDDDAGKLYLADGREIDVNPKLFCSVEQALRVLTNWARRKNLIAINDDVVTFI
jgi:hypothetical protein